MTTRQVQVSYLSTAFSVRSWLLTTDHKRIALLYLGAITLVGSAGTVPAILLHLERLTPQAGLVAHDTFSRLFTLHGQVAVFFVLLPGIPTVLGNFLVPLMIGARSLAFPRLSLITWYVYLGGASGLLWTAAAGGSDSGWIFDVPASSLSPGINVSVSAAAILMALLSLALTVVNLVATVHGLRSPGVTWFRLPLFAWTLYVSGLVWLLVVPLLSASLIGFVFLRLGALSDELEWLRPWSLACAHAAVAASMLPALGIICELVATFSRKRIYGFRTILGCIIGFGLLSLLGSGQHLLAGEAPLGLSLLGLLAWVAPLIMVLHWLATLYRGSISSSAPALFALGFVGLLAVGAPAALFLGNPATDAHLSATMFESGDFHYLFAGAVATGFLGGLHYWWPKMTGRMYPEPWARGSALVLLIGGHLTWGPQLILGWLGMPGRSGEYQEGFHLWNVLSSTGALLFLAGMTMPVLYLIWSLRYGQPAPANPWEAEGLEWRTPSPPPPQNFEHSPVVS